MLQRRPVVSILLALATAACSGHKDDAPSAAQRAPAAKAGPDGLPAGYALPEGGKLIDKSGEDSASTWSYAYPIIPSTLAQRLEDQLEKAGWIAALRVVGDADVVMAYRDDTLVTAVATFGSNAGSSRLTLALKPDASLLVKPPAGYPAGFPFVPFARFQGAEAKGDHTTLTFVYAG